MVARLARDLGPMLRQPYRREDCHRLLREQRSRRDESFLSLVSRAVFENPASPYLALLRHAGIGHADVVEWVRRDGVDGALSALHRAGVYVTLDEFKGRRPIRRGGLERAVRDHDFDNPLVAAHYDGQSGGTRGGGTRARVDLRMLAHEATSEGVLLDGVGALDRPFAVWRPALPAGAGMKTVLRHAKLGTLAERWFTQTPFRPTRPLWKHYAFMAAALAASRAWGRPIPTPELTPLDRAADVARWLAAKRAAGTAACLDAPVSSAVRVCLAAREVGVDVTGTRMIVGSEPITEARARIIADAGCRMASQYALAEVGRLGLGCATPAAIDDVHIALDRVALLQRDRTVGASVVGALFCSTVHPAVPKVMLNVELGDYGVLEERACGCAFDGLGFRQHLHTIRSYEKLTSEGVHFVGTELLRLVEEVLPARFGGHATDYQVLEEEEAGLPRVSLVVSPSVGAIDEASVIGTVLAVLAADGGGARGNRAMAAHWRDAGLLRVVRRAPLATTAAKILPLHVAGTTTTQRR
jgi:hypothetical protein